MTFDRNDSGALQEMAMGITRIAQAVEQAPTLDQIVNGLVDKLGWQGQIVNYTTARTSHDPLESMNAAMVKSNAKGAVVIPEAGAPLAEKSRPSGIDWQQKISSALGCRPGQLTYPLEECVQRIEAMQVMLDNVSVRCDLCGDWHGYRAEHACRPKEAPVEDMVQKECQYCGHSELVSVADLGDAKQSGEALHHCTIGDRIHRALVTNELIEVHDPAADVDNPTRWLSYQFYLHHVNSFKPMTLRRYLGLTGPQFQYLVGVYSNTRKVGPTDIKQARDKYPSA